MGGRQVRKGKEYGEIFDHHYVEFHYADGSILNSQCRHIPGTMSKVDELLVGTKGILRAGDANIVSSKGRRYYTSMTQNWRTILTKQSMTNCLKPLPKASTNLQMLRTVPKAP